MTRYKFIEYPKSDHVVAQGELVISKNGLSTGGLATCSALILSDGEKNMLGHIDASGDPNQIAYFISSNFDVNDPNLKMQIIDAGLNSKVATEIIQRTAGILELQAQFLHRNIDPMGKIRISPNGDVKVLTIADIMQEKQQESHITRNGLSYIFATNAPRKNVEIVEGGINLNIEAVGSMSGKTAHFKDAIIAEEHNPNTSNDDLIGIYIPKR